MKRLRCAVLLAVCAAALAPAPERAHGQDAGPGRKPGNGGGGGGGARGGPAGGFRTDVPSHPVDVVTGRPTRTSVVLSVRATGDAEGCVEWQTGDAAPRRTPVRKLAAGVPAEIAVDGLAVGALHTLRVLTRTVGGTDFTATDPIRVHTQRPAGAPFSFAIQSDSHLDLQTQPELYERTMRNVAEGGADFLFDLGDTFMVDKRRDDFRTALPQYAAQRWYFGLARLPVFLVLGNHDGETGWRSRDAGTEMSEWSLRQRKANFPNPEPDGFYTGNEARDPATGLPGNWYAFEWGDALFVALDPFRATPEKPRDDGWVWTLGAAQHAWLTKTLATSRAKFRFVMIHHLVGGLDADARGGSEAAGLFEWGGRSRTGAEEFQKRRPGWSAPVHELLRRAGPTIVFHGHDHFFARQQADGVLYVGLPQPGHPGGNAEKMAAEYGYREGEFLPSPGHLRVVVTPDAARLELVRSVLPGTESRTGVRNGTVVASHTLRAASAPPTPPTPPTPPAPPAPDRRSGEPAPPDSPPAPAPGSPATPR